VVVTGLQVRQAVRQLSDTVNNNVVTDSEIDARGNEAQSELYDMVLAAAENYFLTSTTFTLSSTIPGNAVSLPADWYKDIGMDEVSDPLNPITIHAGTTFLERNRQDRRRYWFDAGQLVVRPARQAAGKYQHFYTPVAPWINDPAPRFTVRALTLSPLPTPNTYTTGVVIGSPWVGDVIAQTPLSALLVVDGVSIFGDIATGDLVGVFGETNPMHNGIYGCVSNSGSGWQLARLAAFGRDPSVAALAFGDSIGVTSGTANAGRQFRISTPTASITVGTNPINVVETQVPQSLLPWYQFIQIHAAIAVKEKREQDTADLELRLARQIKRV